jgi:hypothetical protein
VNLYRVILRSADPLVVLFRLSHGREVAASCSKTEHHSLVAESVEFAVNVRLSEDGRGCSHDAMAHLVDGAEEKKGDCSLDPDDDIVGWISRASHSFDDGAFLAWAPTGSPSKSESAASLSARDGGELGEQEEAHRSAREIGQKVSAHGVKQCENAAKPRNARPQSPDAHSDDNSDTDSDTQHVDRGALGGGARPVEDGVPVSTPVVHPSAPPSGRIAASLIMTPAREKEESGQSINASVSGRKAAIGDWCCNRSLKLSTPASALRFFCLCLSVVTKTARARALVRRRSHLK